MSVMLALAAVGSLVGDWLYVPPLKDAHSPVDICDSDNGIRYTRDGRFMTFMSDAIGWWRLDRGRLIEQVTHETDGQTNKVRRLRGEPVARSKLQWLSPDHVNLVTRDGTQGLVRCRPSR